MLLIASIVALIGLVTGKVILVIAAALVWLMED